MYLSRLCLEEFRLFRHLDLAIPPAGLRIHGTNAVGKTTLLEAIYLLSTTRSPRAGVEREMVRFGSGQEFGLPPYARLLGELQSASGRCQLELTLAGETPTTPDGEAGLTRKRIKIDGNPRRAIDMVGRLKVVLFSPEDLDLIIGSPGGRRRYLDITLSQLDSVYLRSLSRYGRILLQRNALLRRLQESGEHLTARQAAEELAYWNEELVRLGAIIIRRRYDLVNHLNRLTAVRFAQLTRATNPLSLGYAASVNLAALGGQADRLTGEEREAVIARDFADQLGRAYSTELRRGTSVLGPHRDDLTLTLAGRPVSAYGSRGQQRLTVLALKLAEVDLMHTLAGDWPVLLLDDIASELDPDHRRFVLETVRADGKQLLVTATDRALLDVPALDGLPWLAVGSGEAQLEPGP